MSPFHTNKAFMTTCLVLFSGAQVMANDTIFGQQITLEQEHRLTTSAEVSVPALIDRLREERRLEEARAEALYQLAQRMESPELLWRAARSMADTSLSNADEEQREEAALQGLEWARQAAELNPDDADCQAQLGYLLGITTHLQPMGDRSDHAHETIAAAERALELRPGDALALHTLATVNLRLETLPWIAKRMASDRPSSSMAAAERYAREALAAEPSLANSLLLAKILIADERASEAFTVLTDASVRPNLYPRDLIFRVQILEMIEDLQ